MKPFNLEEAKAGKPICSRDGQPMVFVGMCPKGEFPLVVQNSHTNTIWTLRADGRYLLTGDSTVDVVMAPVKRTVYVNIRKLIKATPAGAAWWFESAEMAVNSAAVFTELYLAIAVPVEIEE